MKTNTSKSRKSEAKLFSGLCFMQGYGGDACKVIKMAVEAVPAQMRQNVTAGYHLLLYWLSLRADCGLHPFFRITSPACLCPPELDCGMLPALLVGLLTVSITASGYQLWLQRI